MGLLVQLCVSAVDVCSLIKEIRLHAADTFADDANIGRLASGLKN